MAFLRAIARLAFTHLSIYFALATICATSMAGSAKSRPKTPSQTNPCEVALANQDLAFSAFLDAPIESYRLTTRSANPGDLEDILNIYLNPQSLKVQNIVPNGDERDYFTHLLAKSAKENESEEEFLRVVIERSTGKIIGFFSGFLDDGREGAIATLDYFSLPEVWGQGFASEIVPEMLSVLRRVQGVAEIEVNASKSNGNAIAFLQKQGFRWRKWVSASALGLESASPVPKEPFARMSMFVDSDEGFGKQRLEFLDIYEKQIDASQTKYLSQVEQLRAAVAKIYANTSMTPSERSQEIFNLLLEERLKSVDTEVADQVRTELQREDIWVVKDDKNGNFRGQLLINRVFSDVHFDINMPSEFLNSEIDWGTRLHEVEHLIQEQTLNKFRQSSYGRDERYRDEFALPHFLFEGGAMRTEWSYWSVVPEARLQELRNIIQKAPNLSAEGRQHALRILGHAGEEVEDFVWEERPARNYQASEIDLNKGHGYVGSPWDPYLAIGIFGSDDLAEFISQRTTELHHQVINYWKFPEYYAFERDYNVVTTVRRAMRATILSHPGNRPILVKLDGVDVSQLGAPRFTKGYTNQEIVTILNDKRLFDATRWYLNEAELTPTDVKKFFGHHLAF